MNFALPDTVTISPDMLRLVSEIDEFRGLWQTGRVLTPERLVGLRRVATIESIGSSTRIEGSRLSDSEVEVLLAGLETKSFATRDEQEVAGYAFVMEQVFAHADQIPLKGNMVRQLRLGKNRVSFSPLARLLASLFDGRETLTNSQALALTAASSSTLKRRFGELIKAGLIERHGEGRGVYYTKRLPGRSE